MEYNEYVMKWSLWTSAAAASLIVPACLGLLLSGTPTLLSPFPSLTVTAGFLLGNQGGIWIALLLPALLFVAWNPALFRADPQCPTRSLILLTILTALTDLYFVESWRLGLEYQGPAFTVGSCVVNILALMLLWTAFIWAKRQPSFPRNLLAHWLLFVWLGWYAFPYLGELP